MKIRFTLFAFVCLGVFFFLESFSNGLAGGGNPPRMQDRTGSPFTENSGTCQTCHNGGGFDPTLNIELLQNDVAVESYLPGETYIMRFTIDASNDPARYAFQSVVLTADTDQNAGTFGDAPSGTRVETVEGRDYFEHSTPNTTTNFFEIEWTAPEAGTGNVNVYATGVAGNGNGTNGGDEGDNAVLEVAENVTSTSFVQGNIDAIAVFPNPAIDEVQVQLDSRVAGTFALQVISLNGQAVIRQQVGVQAGINQLPLNVGNLPKGTYIVQLQQGATAASTKLLKL